MRRNFSKREKNAFYIKQRGLCALCGMSLTDLEGDHVESFSHGGPTAEWNGQALCRLCNRRKGASVIKLRPFQQEINDECLKMIDVGPENYSVRRFVILATPGAGKSLIPALLMRVAKAWGMKLCCVVPRRSLQIQLEESFHLDDKFKLYSGDAKLVSVVNKHNPCKGNDYDGYVISNQALQADTKGINEYEFARNKYILVVDECHHTAEEKAWTQGLMPLVEKCHFLVLMSGTGERHQGERIDFLNVYRKATVNGGDSFSISTKSDNYQKVFTYSRSQSLRDKATIPIYCVMVDGKVTWENVLTKETFKVDSFADPSNIFQVRRALGNAFKTPYFTDVLERGIQHWEKHRHPTSKLLIILNEWDSFARTKAVVEKYELDFVRVDGEMSADEQNEEIEKVKHGNCGVMITVAVAYEGLDVPNFTHIVYLSKIRSVPWISQAIGRACRVSLDLPYDKQMGIVFCPDDPMMLQCVSLIAEDQDEILKERNRPMTVIKSNSGEKELPIDVDPPEEEGPIQGPEEEGLVSGEKDPLEPSPPSPPPGPPVQLDIPIDGMATVDTLWFEEISEKVNKEEFLKVKQIFEDFDQEVSDIKIARYVVEQKEKKGKLQNYEQKVRTLAKGLRPSVRIKRLTTALKEINNQYALRVLMPRLNISLGEACKKSRTILYKKFKKSSDQYSEKDFEDACIFLLKLIEESGFIPKV